MSALIQVRDNRLIIYPDVIRGGKKMARFGVFLAVFLLIFCLWMTMTPGNTDSLQLKGFLLFASLLLFVCLIQLTWGPLIRMNEYTISLQPNPFLEPIEVQWSEIESFIAFTGRNHFFFDVTLAPAHSEAFLQRQSPFMRKLLAKRLIHSGRIARFSQLYLPCAQSDLLGVIDEIYYAQISMNRITLDKLW